MEGARAPGAFVRPPGWEPQEESHSDGSLPEVVQNASGYRALNRASEGDQGQEQSSSSRDAQNTNERQTSRSAENSRGLTRSSDAPSRRDGSHKRGRSRDNSESSHSGGSESSYSVTSNSSGGNSRRASRHRKKSHRGHKKHRSSRRDKHSRSRSGRQKDIAGLWKNWAMPKLKDEMSHDEMRLAWPTWRDMLLKVMAMNRPKRRDWTEEEKYMTLMMHGGNIIREIASFSTPVTGEVIDPDPRRTPAFSNLVNRCNVAFRPKDVTMEITILRAMHQKKDETVREFLEKARKQISLCGYKTGDERDRELIMLLKGNTIDAQEISKHATGQNLEQLEALAINLEAIRQQESRERAKLADKILPKQEIDVHAISDRAGGPRHSFPTFNSFRSASRDRRGDPAASFQGQQRGAGNQCGKCGKAGGNNERFGCPAEKMSCYNCGRRGHMARMCKSKPQQSQQYRQSSNQHQPIPKSTKREQVNHLGERTRDNRSPDYKVKGEDEDWVN